MRLLPLSLRAFHADAAYLDMHLIQRLVARVYRQIFEPQTHLVTQGS